MYCTKCGRVLPNKSRYCPFCGTKVPVVDLEDGNNNNILDGIKNKFQIPEFVLKYKRIVVVYVMWTITNLFLWILSSPIKIDYKYKSNRVGEFESDFTYDGGRYYRFEKDISDGFYPFNKSISSIVDGSNCHFSLIDNIDVYDFSEFFFYTIIIPLLIVGFVKAWPYITSCIIPFGKRLLKRISIFIQLFYAKYKNHKKTNVVTDSDKIEENQEITITEGCKPKEEMFVLMPLSRRIIGSAIDKIILIVVFFVGTIIINPFGGAGKLGKYVGLLKVSPNNYEYIDKAAINSYGMYKENVSVYYQEKERLSNTPPHISSTKELDVNMTSSFIFLNLFYFFFFEFALYASLGKSMLGGVIQESYKNNNYSKNALIRTLFRGLFISVFVYLIHFVMGLSYYKVMLLYFLIMDVPVFFSKRSLLDICTRTTYVKRKK